MKSGAFVNKLKAFLYPFIIPIVFGLIYKGVVDHYAADLGAGIILFLILLIFLFIIVPCYCFLYGKRVLLKERRKYLFTLYNSFVFAISYFLPLCDEGETYLYSAILFLWIELWGLLPLFIYRKKGRMIDE